MEELEGLIEFAENPEPRCALVLVLDTSGSMSGEPIRELNAGLALLAQELQDDALASQRVEVAIVTFGAGGVTVAQDFTVAADFDPPVLETGGLTPMGRAVVAAEQLVSDRKQTYKDAGIAYFRPWIFLITDGAPTDKWSKAQELVRKGEAESAFAFFAVGVADADMGVLGDLSSRDPIKLQGLAFRELFQWLSQSQRQVSSSRPGEQLALPAPTGWAEV